VGDLMIEQITAYPRDASWHDNPNTSYPKKLHRLSADDRVMAHCAPSRIMLIIEHPILVADASDPRLCRRCFPRP
jgi:hypothetical protein